MTAALLALLVEQAAAGVSFDAPPLHEDDVARRLRFGTQLDSRPVAAARRTDDPDRALAPEQVAGYLAKYATKSATDSTATNSPHARRLRATIEAVADRIRTDARVDGMPLRDHPYGLLFKWRHMLGFRGHFSTKSRRYSTTLGQLRRRRVRYERALAAAHRDGRTLDVRTLDVRTLDDLLQDDTEETTLVVGHWTYAGTGWDTDGDAELAKAAAARAREYAQERAASKHQND